MSASAATPESGPIDTVVIDVDGTLVDSVYQHVAAWARAFAEADVHVVARDLHRAIGIGGDRLVAEVADQETEDQLGDQLRQRHDELFEEALGRVRALPGARELLAELRSRGLNVVIATSGPPDQTEQMLTLVDGNDLAHDRATSEDVEASKPAPDVVGSAVESVGGRRAVMLGDAVWDVEAAHNRGDDCIGLLSGGISEQELLDAGAHSVYADAQDLLEHLDDSLIARH